MPVNIRRLSLDAPNTTALRLALRKGLLYN